MTREVAGQVHILTWDKESIISAKLQNRTVWTSAGLLLQDTLQEERSRYGLQLEAKSMARVPYTPPAHFPYKRYSHWPRLQIWKRLKNVARAVMRSDVSWEGHPRSTLSDTKLLLRCNLLQFQYHKHCSSVDKILFGHPRDGPITTVP